MSIEHKAKRYMMPWLKETDAKGFFEYAKQYYAKAFNYAVDVTAYILNVHETEDIEIKRLIVTSEGNVEIFKVIFDKIASPLVYLYDHWNALPLEEKEKYK